MDSYHRRPKRVTVRQLSDRLDALSALVRKLAQGEKVMADDFQTLDTDVDSLTATVAAQKTAITQGLANIQAEIDALKNLHPDISGDLTKLEAAVQGVKDNTASVSAADPGTPTG